MRPDASAEFLLIQRTRTPLSSARSAAPRDRNKNEAFTARLTVDSTGNAYSLRTKTRVAPVWPWTRTIRAFCLPACGNWRCTPGENLAVDQGAAPTNSERLFALIQTRDQGSLWRSDDGGERWQAVNFQRQLIGRAGYYIRIAVSTGNDNEVYVANSSFLQSLDGGETFREVPWGGDNHDIWIDPLNPDRFVITDDGGLNITTVHGRGFHRVQLPIGQMYHVAVDNQAPYYVYSNMQDGPNMRGPSIPAPLEYGRVVDTGWDRRMGGCESGFTLPDPTDPNIVWASCYGNEVTRWDARTKRARSVSPWIHTLDSPPNELKYRCHWTPPLAIDPFDHNTVYYGCQVVF